MLGVQNTCHISKIEMKYTYIYIRASLLILLLTAYQNGNSSDVLSETKYITVSFYLFLENLSNFCEKFKLPMWFELNFYWIVLV